MDPKVFVVFLLLYSTAHSLPSSSPDEGNSVESSETLNIFLDVNQKTNGEDDAGGITGDSKIVCDNNKTRMLPSVDQIEEIQKRSQRFPSMRLPRIPGEEAIGIHPQRNCSVVRVEISKEVQIPPFHEVEKEEESFQNRIRRRHLPKEKSRDDRMISLTEKSKTLPFKPSFKESKPFIRKRNCTKVKPKATRDHRKIRIGRRRKLPKPEHSQIPTTEYPILRAFTLPSAENEEDEQKENCDLEETERTSGDPKLTTTTSVSTRVHDLSTPGSKTGTILPHALITMESDSSEENPIVATTLVGQPIRTTAKSQDAVTPSEDESGEPSTISTPEPEFNYDALEKKMGRGIRQSQLKMNSSRSSASTPPVESWTTLDNSFLSLSTTTGESTTVTYESKSTDEMSSVSSKVHGSTLPVVTSTDNVNNVWKSTTVLQSGRIKGRGLSPGGLPLWVNTAGPNMSDMTSEAPKISTSERENGKIKELSPSVIQGRLSKGGVMTESLKSNDLLKELPILKDYIYSQLKRRNRYKNRRKETEYLFGPQRFPEFNSSRKLFVVGK